MSQEQESLVEIRFGDMKHDALTNTVPKDLPKLLCDVCTKCVSFGGSETFEESHFTLLDVFVCQSACVE